MSDMRRYVCWADEAVRAATPRDAASLQPGHFQAVHHPLKLRQRRIDTQTGGRWVEEGEIVDVLEGPLRPDGYLLVPIVGGSGTGKSHLVRWVYERTRERGDWVSRYLAKNRTSIRRVIEIVIEGLEGPAIEAAREALLGAPAQTESEEVLAERLLDELALITSEESTGEAEPDARSAQMRAKLNRELPDILRDPVVRRRLTSEGSVIPRLVGLAMRGRVDGDGLDDDAIRVAEEDLPLAFEEIGEASSGARKLLTQLASVADLRAAAIDLINKALPSAVKRVFVSGQVDLIEVFREVRRELLASDRELVLFVEDFTVLHGVEREFLDAIVEPARSPDGDLCPLRVLFAVTQGHFDGLDTVKTRCDDAYWLDATYSAEGVDANEAISFLGRYLNACRQEPTDLEQDWADRQGDGWLENACDACDYQVSCHETFGRSEEGYGLYPYNPSAVDTFVGALSSERFDPREVVRELVNRFLVVASADLDRGDFPSDELARPFDEHSEPVAPVVQAQIRNQRPGDWAQVVNTIRYWADPSGAVGDSTLGAFGLDPLREIDLSAATGTPSARAAAPNGASRRQDQEQGADGSVQARLRSPWSRIYDELNGWAGNQRDLRATATNQLKKLVHKSIAQNLDWSGLPLNLDQKRFNHETHIHIEGTVTQQTGEPIITIRQDADTATALQGMILLQGIPDGSDYPQADRFRRQVAGYLEQWTSTMSDALAREPDPAATQAVVGLLVCAIVSGACESASTAHDYLAALFGGGESTVAPTRSEKWLALADSAGDTHRRLRPIVEAHFGEARGTGDTRAVRADLMLGAIREFIDAWQLESSDSATDRFMRAVAPAVDGEWGVLKEMVSRSAPHLDPSRSWAEQVEKVVELVNAAHRLGRLSDHDAARDLRHMAAAQDTDAHKIILDLASRIVDDTPAIDQLRIVASTLPDTVATTSRFVSRAESAMSSISADLDDRRAEAPEGEILEDVASAVLAEAGRLATTVEELEA